MEQLVGELLREVLGEVAQSLQRDLEVKSKFPISLGTETKKVNFAFVEIGAPLSVVEANFYSTGGSKPLETLTRAYPELQVELRKRDIGLIVITDGAGWLQMRQIVSVMLEKLEHALNLRQAKGGELKEKILRLLTRA